MEATAFADQSVLCILDHTPETPASLEIKFFQHELAFQEFRRKTESQLASLMEKNEHLLQENASLKTAMALLTTAQKSAPPGATKKSEEPATDAPSYKSAVQNSRYSASMFASAFASRSSSLGDSQHQSAKVHSGPSVQVPISTPRTAAPPQTPRARSAPVAIKAQQLRSRMNDAATVEDLATIIMQKERPPQEKDWPEPVLVSSVVASFPLAGSIRASQRLTREAILLFVKQSFDVILLDVLPFAGGRYADLLLRLEDLASLTKKLEERGFLPTLPAVPPHLRSTSSSPVVARRFRAYLNAKSHNQRHAAFTGLEEKMILAILSRAAEHKSSNASWTRAMHSRVKQDLFEVTEAWNPGQGRKEFATTDFVPDPDSDPDDDAMEGWSSLRAAKSRPGLGFSSRA